jgi:hypothetical protein
VSDRASYSGALLKVVGETRPPSLEQRGWMVPSRPTTTFQFPALPAGPGR